VSSIREKIDKWIEKEGLRPDLKREVLGLKAFSSGRRKMIVLPKNMKVCEIHKDKITLQFFLPSGSYATIFLLKVINYPL
jgi:tRNA pseudouridine13 synthase